MKKFSFLTRLTVLFLMALCLFGCERKTKEQLLREGIEQKDSQNLKGAVVLFKSALEKDPNYFEARRQLGLVYLASGNLVQAAKELEKVLLQAPGDAEVLKDLADLYLATDRQEEAVALAQRLVKEQGETPESLELLGKSLFGKGDLEKAEECFKKAFRLDPDRIGVRNRLAALHVSEGRLDEARKLLRETTEKHPKEVDAYYLLIQLEAKSGNVDQALAEGRRLLQVAPNEVRAPYLLGLLELGRGDIPAARRLADEVLQRNPQVPAVIRLQGLVLCAEGKYQEAAEKLQASLQQNPDPTALYFLGLAQYELERYELALNQFQAVLDSLPGHTQSRLMVALTLFRQKRFEDSRYAAEKVLESDPGNALAHDVLGSILMEQGDYDRGMAELDRAIELFPDLAQAHLKKGLFNLSKGDFDKAEAPLEEALRIAPEAMNSRLLLAMSYLKRQNFTQAIQTLREGLAGKPEDAVLHNYLAGAYAGQGKTEEAVAELQKAKKLKPDFFAPYFNLANFCLARGDTSGATAEYRQILEIAPDNLRALLPLAALEELQGDRKSAEVLLAQAREIGAPEGYLASSSYFNRIAQPKKALESLSAGLERHPGHPALLEQQGKELFRQGHGDEALAVFRLLAEKQPDTGLPLLIHALVESGRAPEAEKIALKEIDKNPYGATGHLLLEKVHQLQKDPVRQEQALKNGLARVRDDVLLSTRLAEFYAGQQKNEQAVAILEKVRKQHPDYVPALFLQGTILDQSGDKRQARELYQTALDKNAAYVPALNNLAYLNADNYGDLDEALDLAARAFRLSPDNPGIMDTLGFVLIRLGRQAEALPYLEKSAAMLPGQPDVLIHLALAYSGAGKPDQAAETLKKVAAMPYPAQALQAKDMLREMSAKAENGGKR